MNFKYFLNEPYLHGKEEEYVLDVLKSGWLSPGGKHVKVFEEKFAERVGVKHALAVQSGTAALHTALLALGVGKGDKVVIPTCNCGAGLTPIVQCGATPVILDVEPETFGLDFNAFAEYVKKEKPKAVVPVHIYGFPMRDLEKILRLSREKGILILEDACESLGAEYQGRKIGSFGDITAFSVRSEKMIGVGEGGMVTTDNKDLADKARYWASRAAPYRGAEHPFWYMYVYTGIGMNYLMPSLLGAVGRAQIENFDEILSRKVKVGEAYQSLLGNVQGIKLQKKIEGANPCYWLNSVIFEDKPTEEVRAIGNALRAQGVEVRSVFWPLGDQDAFRQYAHGKQDTGKYLFEKGLIIPSASSLGDNDCQGVKEVAGMLLKLAGKK